MLKDYSHPSAHFLKYAIREIVETAQKIQKLDPTMNFVWENIGDPIAKGWTVPTFLKEIIIQEVNKKDDLLFGYTHSRGRIETRKWVVEYAKRYSPSSQLNEEDVLFTSGLGSAISILYQMLRKGNRIIQPTPSYPTHTSFESFATGAPSISYNLDPMNEWQPDLNHLESQLKSHPEISGILVINPNNPTGAVYSKETLEKIIKLAEKYELFIISDEVYFRMVYNGHTHSHITELAQNKVPLIVLKGTSKDIPWPGGRCGWVEFHNTHLNEEYKKYAETVKQRILLEVCSTILPQVVLPQVYDHPDFAKWNENYNRELEATGNMITDTLSQIPEMIINGTNGAFYMMPLFKEGVLNEKQTLPIKNPEVKRFIETEVSKPNFPIDQRFTYYLLGSTGIVTVPASGFYSPFPGFRITTLDRDPERSKMTYETIVSSIKEYIKNE